MPPPPWLPIRLSWHQWGDQDVICSGLGYLGSLNFTGISSIKRDNSAALVRVKLGCAKNIQHWPLSDTQWAAVNWCSPASSLSTVLVSFSLATLPHMLTCSLLCPQHPHCVAHEWGCINVYKWGLYYRCRIPVWAAQLLSPSVHERC